VKTAGKSVAVGAASASEQQRVKMQLQQLLASYRRDGQARRLRPLSLDGREYELQHWIDWLETEGRLRKLNQLTADDIVSFLACEQTRLAASTCVTMYNHLHAFCAWLVRMDYIERSPMASMQSPKAPMKVTPILSHEEVTKLLAACQGKRFIDRRATFLWLKSPKDCPKRAVGFDFDGAEFTHVRAKVTFEVLMASFGLEGDPALERIGALIHYLDVGGVPVPEAAGLEALLRGARAAWSDDDALLAEAGRLFEYLYAHYATGT
jgi:hypothetical protein